MRLSEERNSIVVQKDEAVRQVVELQNQVSGPNGCADRFGCG